MVTRRCLLASAFAGLIKAGPDVQIQFDGSSFRVDGWTPPPEPKDGWTGLFSVYSGADKDVPAMLGTYSVENGVLHFKPRFRPAAGMAVRAVFCLPGRPPIEKIFRERTQHAEPTTFVENVFPSVNVVPANLLKFYLQFSAPMQRAQAWQNLSLLDSNRGKVDLPFLEIDQELWDLEGRRLTVLFDPGRIKRGVLPRDETGTALTEGAEYTLVIGRNWQDANGTPLKASFRKRFRVTAEDRIAVDVRSWKLRIPAADTTDSLDVQFGESMDYALLQRTLDVRDPARRVSGEARVEREETAWSFQPHEPWRSGEHSLLVDKSLEDLAGNQVGKPFDVDIFDPITRTKVAKTESLRFRIGPKKSLQGPR